jgi:hypothetical protein
MNLPVTRPERSLHYIPYLLRGWANACSECSDLLSDALEQTAFDMLQLHGLTYEDHDEWLDGLDEDDHWDVARHLCDDSCSETYGGSTIMMRAKELTEAALIEFVRALMQEIEHCASEWLQCYITENKTSWGEEMEITESMDENEESDEDDGDDGSVRYWTRRRNECRNMQRIFEGQLPLLIALQMDQLTGEMVQEKAVCAA